MKILTLFLIIATSINLAYSQTNDEFWAEEFIAEVFYGNMTEKSPKVYLEKRADFPYLPSDYKVPNSSSADNVFKVLDAYEMMRLFAEDSLKWNENAPVFQQLKYKKLIFVDDISKLSKKKQKKTRTLIKPIFTKNGEYALVEVTRGVRYGKSVVVSTTFHDIYQRIEGKWVRIDSREMWHYD